MESKTSGHVRRNEWQCLLLFVVGAAAFYRCWMWTLDCPGHHDGLELHDPISYNLAQEQSFGFFDDIPNEEWRRKQEKVRKHKDHRPGSHALDRWPGIRASEFYLLHYEPLFTCPDIVRVGGVGDGPKWTCDPHRLSRIARERKCLIYSIGSSGNYDWEDGLFEMLGPACEIHVFDPARDFTRPGDKEKNIHFHFWGLSSSYDNSMSLMANREWHTFQETVQMLGHENRTIDIFKIDCENCEWYTFKDWMNPKVDVRQVLIEVHNIPTPGYSSPVGLKPTDFFDGMRDEGFAMFSKEANFHYSGGNCQEFGYVKLRKDFFNLTTN